MQRDHRSNSLPGSPPKKRLQAPSALDRHESERGEAAYTKVLTPPIVDNIILIRLNS